MGEARVLHLRFGPFELEEAEARLTSQGQVVALPPKALAVLCELARKPGRLVTKEALLEAVWGHQYVSESTVKRTICELRTALEDDAKQPRYIETASRRGYRFIGVGNAGQTLEGGSKPAPLVQAALGQVKLHAAPVIVGRDAALSRLRVAWNETVEGHPRFVWITGEAGVGKTTLVQSFVSESGSGVIARGQCVEQFGAGEPYLPVLEALGSACRRDGRLASMVRSVAPTWLVQLPWLISEAERSTLQLELAGSSQDRMLREFGELIEQYTVERPLLLVTEDLSWSDHATVHLINYLARRRGTARLMWIGTFRLAELIAENHPLNALRHELRAHRLCDEILLQPFSERELAEYLASRLPGMDPSEPFVRSLHAHTDGLPLFVVNVIEGMVAEGVIEREAKQGFPDPSTPASWNVPGSLAGIIESQIARAPAEVRAILEVGSVCGNEFWPEVVADALGRDIAPVLDECDKLVRQQHWLRQVAVEQSTDGSLETRYGFRHALYRHVFYQRMGPSRQAMLHRRVAEAMESRRGDGLEVTAAELASHFELGRSAMAALRHYVDAADSALRRFAPSEAAKLTARALALLPRVPEGQARMELELALVVRHGIASQEVVETAAPEATKAYERAQALFEALPEAPERAWVMSGLGWALQVRGQFRESHELARRIHELAQVHADPVLLASACNLFGSACLYQADFVSARRWLEQGLATCQHLGDRLTNLPFHVDLIVSMHGQLCEPLLRLGLPDEAMKHRDEALMRAQALRRPITEVAALRWAARLEVELELPELVLKRAVGLEELKAHRAHLMAEPSAHLYRGWALARMGETTPGHASILEALSCFERLGYAVGTSQMHGFGAEAMLLSGQWAAARQHVEDGLRIAERNGEHAFVPDLLLLKSRAEAGEGKIEAARASTRSALAKARAQRASWSELAALTAIPALDAASPDDWAGLGAVLDRIQGGSELALVKRARAVLTLRKRSPR
jgi:DNA-binding winged helix-turn-helix (wHTH) protein/tetratricopeptide (TPR) repeat protein